MNWYTITVNGSERHDGEAGHTYVTPAENLEVAIERVIAEHMSEYDDDDVIVNERQSHKGRPSHSAQYNWGYLIPDGYEPTKEDQAYQAGAAVTAYRVSRVIPNRDQTMADAVAELIVDLRVLLDTF
jgi:hypothetical protein